MIGFRGTDFQSVRVAIVATALFCRAVPANGQTMEVKALRPAGAQRGQTVAVNVVGKVGKRPVEVWTSHPSLTATVRDDQDWIDVTVAGDCPPGVHWMRLHNALDASPLRPFLVGELPEVNEDETNDLVEKANAVDISSERPGIVANGVLAKSGDVDGWAVELKSGQRMVAALAAHHDLGSPMDAVLQIVDDRGFVLEQNDDTRGNDPRLVFECPRDGRYVVRVFAFPATPNSTIRLAGGEDYVYRLTLTTGPYVDHVVPLAVRRDGDHSVRPRGWNLPDPAPAAEVVVRPDADVATSPAGPSDPVSLAVVDHSSLDETEAGEKPTEIPVTITGHIELPKEVDEFAFRAAKGDKLSITVESRALGFPLDPAIEVVDETGKSLKSADDAKREEYDPVLAFDVPADGRYRVRVRDVFEQFGPRHAYRLTIARRDPNFALTVAADKFSVAAGKSVTIPVTIERREGFGETIAVRVEGLPEGTTCAVVESDPKGDSKGKVELEIVAAEGATASGPIRIVGEAGREHIATGPIAATPGRSTRHLWLTVPKE